MTEQVQHYSIRVRYTAGPARHDEAVVAIGPFASALNCDFALRRLNQHISEGSAWSFEPYDQDHHGCDLWAYQQRVFARLSNVISPRFLDEHPEVLLDLFRDVTGDGHGWYDIIRDGEWVNVRPDRGAFGPDEVITAAGGASTTVGALAADLAFGRLDLALLGQTEQRDVLRLHLLSTHCQLNAATLTDGEAAEAHEHEHRGPGTIRNHDPESTTWDYMKAAVMLAEVEDGFLTEQEKDRYVGAFNAHIERTRYSGQARTKPWKHAPAIYVEERQYAVSILPAEHPVRRHYEITVKRCSRTGDQWIVQYGAQIADRNGDLSYNDPTVQQHVFPLNEALDLARKLAPTVSVTDEHTALDVLNSPDKEWR